MHRPHRAAPQLFGTAPVWVAALAAAAFIGMDALVKALANRYGVVQLTWFRFAGGAVFAVAIWAFWRTPMPGLAQWRMHLLRAVLLLLTLVLYFAALARLELAQAVAMGYTAPIFTSLLAMAWLHERPPAAIWAALALGMLGALVALWPAMRGSGGLHLVGLLLAGCSALTFAFVMVLTRKQAQHDALPTFLLLQNLIPMALLGVPVMVQWTPLHDDDLGFVVAIGALATVGLGAITWSLRHMEASRLAPVEYTGFIWAAAVGYLAFGEVPSTTTTASAALIICGCLLLLRR
ncbi:MAG: DMT family transporter [Rubrivivax sp.]|nr:DMT family transporter [Rubrivivax sp.]